MIESLAGDLGHDVSDRLKNTLNNQRRVDSCSKHAQNELPKSFGAVWVQKMNNIKKVGDDVSLDWRLSYQNPITNIINSPLCHWNTSTCNIAFNNVPLASNLVACHKANPRSNSKTVYNGSFKIHGSRLLCIHHNTALSQPNAMTFQNCANNQASRCYYLNH